MGRARKSLLCLVAGWALTLSSVEARANMAAVQREPGQLALSGAPADATSRVQVEVLREELRFDCVFREPEVECGFDARYHLRNPTEAVQRIAATFYGTRSREVRVEVDGVAAPTRTERATEETEPSPFNDEALLRELPRRSFEPFDKTSFDLDVPPGREVTLRVVGVTAPGLRFVPSGYVVPAVYARHVEFAPDRRPRLFDLEYFVAPIRTWAGDPEISVEVVLPAGFRSQVETDRVAWARSEENGREVMRARVPASSAPDVLSVTLERPVQTLIVGGPQVALGARLGREAGFRARLGYQLAAPAWLLYSVSAETDFRRQMVLTPLVQAASPTLLIIPSFGVGMGAPIQVAPTTRVGGRLLVDAHLYGLGLVTTVDYYPETDSAPEDVQVALMVQLSL